MLALLVGCARGPARPDEPPTGPRGRKEVIQAVLPSNVRVAVLEAGEAVRLASGVVLRSGASTAWVITNAHVAAHALRGRALEVWVGPEGEEVRHPARVVALGEEPDMDLAVLEVEGLSAPAARLADEDIEVGDDLVAVAAPYGRGLSVSTGIVSQFGRDAKKGWRLKTDAPIGYGASGGGLFRASDGALLGVVEGYRTARLELPAGDRSLSFEVPMPGETFAAPAPKIRAFVRQHGLGHLLDDTATAARWTHAETAP